MKKDTKFMLCTCTVSKVAMSASMLCALGSPVWAASEKIEMVDVRGYTNLLTKGTQEKLIQVMQKGLGQMTVSDVPALRARGQAVLDASTANGFVLVELVEKNPNKQKPVFVVVPNLKGVSYNTNGQGYDADNVKASLPSLNIGKPLSAQAAWVDQRELDLANINPLKRTTVTYDVKPDQGVEARVVADMPKGNKVGTVELNNFGNDTTGRTQIMLGFVHANLTDHDDVLSINALAPTKDAGVAHTESVSYSMPFYDLHSMASVSYVRSRANVQSQPFGNTTQLTSLGNADATSLKWNYLLSPLGVGLQDKASVNVGVSNRTYLGTQDLSGITFGQYDLTSRPLSLGAAWSIQPSADTSVETSLTWSKMTPGRWGSSSPASFAQARPGAELGYTLYNYDVALSQRNVWNALNFSQRVMGQYTKDKLVPNEQASIIGNYAVRGFANYVARGDKSAVLKLDMMTMPMSMDEMGIVQPYVFYDYGRKTGGNDEAVVRLSSWGSGLRWQTNSVSPLQLNIYTVKLQQGATLESVKDKARLFVQATYAF